MKKRIRVWIILSGHKVPLGKKSIIMGVLNVTPDSFSDGGQFLRPDHAIRHGLSLARDGADWIDVGGESTRPGALPVSTADELRRVIPVIRGLRAKLPGLPISIDTTKAEVAEAAIRAGANILNDVSGLRFDPGIALVARQYRVPLILMHLRGRPQTMPCKAFAKSIWRSLGRGLGWSIREALRLGVRRSQLILDPGLGFGKTRRQNFEILAGLHRLHRWGLPILAGASRKSFVQAVASGEGFAVCRDRKRILWPITGLPGQYGARRQTVVYPPQRESITPLDFADAAMAAAAILAGAHIVRVHNAAAVLPAVRLADAMLATL